MHSKFSILHMVMQSFNEEQHYNLWIKLIHVHYTLNKLYFWMLIMWYKHKAGRCLGRTVCTNREEKIRMKSDDGFHCGFGNMCHCYWTRTTLSQAVKSLHWLWQSTLNQLLLVFHSRPCCCLLLYSTRVTLMTNCGCLNRMNCPLLEARYNAQKHCLACERVVETVKIYMFALTYTPLICL